MALRVLTSCLALAILAAQMMPAAAAPRVDAKAKAWVADVVSRIGAADRAATARHRDAAGR